MCIAIYSERGNDIPCEEYLKNSFENNNDGAGYAFNTDDGRVRIHKGLMTWEAFKSAFFKDAKKFNFKKRGVLIHFRIGTHGGLIPECTHPFPLIDDAGTLHKLELYSEYAVIHNGIISLTSAEATKADKMSDTMIFIQKYMTKIATNKDWFYNPENMALIDSLASSKIAVMNGKGEIVSTSGFTKDKDGNWYSNGTYKYGSHYTYSYKKGSSTAKNWDYWKNYYDGYYDGYDDYYNGYDSGATNYFFAQKMSPEQYILMENGTRIDDNDEFDYLVSTANNVYRGKKGISASYRITEKDSLTFIGRGETYLKRSNKKCTPYGSCTIAYEAIRNDTKEADKDSESSKTKEKHLKGSTYAPAHLLKKGEMIFSTNGNSYFWEEGDDPIFITNIGEILFTMGEKLELEGKYVEGPDMYYADDGILADENGTAIDSEYDYLINLDLIQDWTDED